MNSTKFFIYKIYQNDVQGYDTYSDAIVVASTILEAKCLHPNEDHKYSIIEKKWISELNPHQNYIPDTWTLDIDKISVELIGEADTKYTKPCVILSSFHAG